MACSGVDGVVKIWSTDSTARITTIFCFAEVLSLEWETKTNKLLLCGTTDARIKVWNVFGDRDVGDIITDQECPRVEDLSCNPSGANFVAALSSSRRDAGQLVLYNLKTFKMENKLTISKTSTVTALSHNHNGSLVLAGSTDGMIRVFDMKTCAAIAGWQAHTHEVVAVQFSADETSIFSVGKDNRIMQWSMHTIAKMVREYSYPGFCRERPFLNGRIAFDSEGHHFVVPSLFNYAIIYHVDHSTPVSLVQGHAQPVIAVDWHPTTDTIISGSIDQSVKVTTLTKR
jgi:WD40 repeat protein